jgi:hypothetical protein
MRQRQAKRKASESLGDSSSSLLNAHRVNLDAPPDEIASILLAWLPRDATLNHKQSKNLLKAVDLAKAELRHRTNLVSKKCQDVGSQQPLHFCEGKVALSEDVFLHILDFLPKTEVVHKISLVSTPWLSVTRSPRMWHTLGPGSGLVEKSLQVTNMDHLLALLNRPQFPSLKTLVPPNKVRSRKKAFEKIAEACPLLEEIDLGFDSFSKMHPDDNDLMKIASVFPHLGKIHLRMRKITGKGLIQFAENMAERLVDLQLGAGYMSENYLSGNTLEAVSRHCPNLESFFYDEKYHREPLSKESIIALVRNCPKLKRLAIMFTRQLSPEANMLQVNKLQVEALEYIAANAHNLCHFVFVVPFGQYQAVRSKPVYDRLDDKIEKFELLEAAFEFKSRIKIARNKGENWYS